MLPRTLAQEPTRRPEPSRLRSATVAYWLSGTAAAESFWSVSAWLPDDCTGLTMNTLPVPVEVPLPGFVADAGDAATRVAASDAPIARAMAGLVRDCFTVASHSSGGGRSATGDGTPREGPVGLCELGAQLVAGAAARAPDS